MRIARTLTKTALVGGLAATLASAQPPAPPAGQPAAKRPAERFPVPKPDPAAVKAAIAKGADFLKATATNGGAHGLGSIALAGIALLEAGVPVTDPALQAATASVRRSAPDETQTYNVSLAVLYLDRLGATEDRALIQSLGVRLYGGLTAGGGFGYTCPKVNAPAGQPGQAGLLGTNPGVPPGRGQPAAPPEKEKPAAPPNGFPQAPPRGKPAAPNAPAVPAAAKELEPAALADYVATRQALFANGRQGGDGDNSNTQFGMIALWVASRNGVPADDAFALIEAHFLLTQSLADAGWPYSGNGQSTTAMTCAGLLGLAIGASRTPAEAAPKPAAPPPPNDPFYAPPKAAPAAKGPDAVRKLATDAALKSVGFALQRLATGNAALNGMVGLGDEYYTLWSVERMAVAYGLDTLGDVDWHALGCAYLLPQQQPDGSFRGGKHDAAVNTAFALLFLAKANFTQGLTKQLKGKVKDPGKSELKAGSILDPVGGPRAVDSPDHSPGMPAKPDPDAPPPAAAPDAAKLAQELAESTAFTAKLAELRDAKGGEYTTAIVAALPKLPAPKQTLARAALAERLTRMTAKTLRAMLADSDPELRRAASLACGAKGDAAHVGDLIRRLTDANEAVVQAAKASLKTLTQQDFGPADGADAAAKEAALAAWTKWHLANPVGVKGPQ